MKEFSNIKSLIEDQSNNILKEKHLKIYQVNNISDLESDIIQILVEDLTRPNKPLDFEILSQVTEDISNMMDNLIKDDTPYMLEIASGGVEKEIRTEEELIKATEQYVNIVFNGEINKQKEINATLENYSNETKDFEISYFIKGQKKKSKIKWSDIKTVRYAIKF